MWTKFQNISKKLFVLIVILLIGFIFSYSMVIPNINIKINSFEFFEFEAEISYLSSIVFGIFLSRFISKMNCLKFIIGIICLLGTLYYILATRSLNNPNFNFYDFIGNKIISIDYVLRILVMVTVALILKKQGILGEWFLNVPINLLFSIVLAPLVLLNSEVIFYFNDTINFTIYNLLIIYILVFSLLFFCFTALDSFINNKSDLFGAAFTSILLAILFNGTIQYGIKNEEMLLERYIFPGATLYQIIVLFFIFLIFYIVVNRFLLSTLINIFIGGSISTVNYLKFEMRNEPFLISDFIWIKEIKFLSSFINPKLLILISIVFSLIVFIYFFLSKKILPGKITNTIQSRILILLLPIVFFVGTLSVYKFRTDSKIINGLPVISVVNNWYDISWFGFSTDARYKSLMYVWTKQLTDSVMERPINYSKKSISKLVSKYEKRALDINSSRTEEISNQTVIYILSESLSNPNRIDDISVSENVLSNIDTIKSQTTSGLMKSDGFGGGTANMEFQTITSLPFYNFSSGVSVLMTEIFPKLKVIPAISNSFKKGERLVIHGLNASYYNRKSFYEDLDFDRQIFLKESNETLQNIEYFGENISDKTTYQNVIDNIDESSNQFFSVITIQNHSPWNIKEPNSVKVSGKYLDKFQMDSLESYANMLKVTDDETIKFLKKLETFDKNITVVFYGDHLPGLYPSELFKNNPASQYQTDYFIWSNFDTPKMNYPLVNSSDFTAQLLKQTNSKVTGYQALLTDVLDFASIDKSELDSNQENIANDLKLLQYDLTVGKGYLKNYQDFFERK